MSCVLPIDFSKMDCIEMKVKKKKKLLVISRSQAWTNSLRTHPRELNDGYSLNSVHLGKLFPKYKTFPHF